MTEEKIAPEENAEETADATAGEETAAPKVTETPEEPAEALAEAETAPEPEAPTEEEPEEEGKKKKIRHLSLEEVEKKLARARIKMGGEASVYVKHLQTRKKELLGNRE